MSKLDIQPDSTQFENIEAQYDTASVVKAVDPNVLPVVPYNTRMKVAWRLIPILSIIYSASVIDRINIGQVSIFFSLLFSLSLSSIVLIVWQAKVVGMSVDLNLIESRYNVALLVFFPAYLM